MTDQLNDAQREAVEHFEGPMLVLAGPGSGKTRVVTQRVARLLERGVRPSELLALTFTNKAADEMRARIERLAPGRTVWVSTFHRFCARLLRQYAPLVGLAENYTIYDTDDSLRALKRAIETLDFDPTHYTPEQLARGISRIKNSLNAPQHAGERGTSALTDVLARVYPAYQRRLLESNAVDFDDLLLHVASLLRDVPEVRAELDERFKFVLVDEYQDTNHAQYLIVKALAQDYRNLAVTGDPDQSIYGWRGANLSNILDFERDYPDVRVVRLEQNYRSTQNILDVASQLIAHNVRRKRKELYTDQQGGTPVRWTTHATNQAEARSIAAEMATEISEGRRRASDFAVFYRVNALSRTLEDALRERGVPYQIVNGVEFYQRREIKDVVAYLQLLNNPRDDVAFLRIINAPARGIGRTTLDRLGAFAARMHIPLLEAARQSGLVEGLAKRAATALATFVAMFDRVSEAMHQPVEQLVRTLLTESGYQLNLLDSNTEEDLERLANIEELVTAAREFDMRHPTDGSLEGFLEQVCLVNDTDAWSDSDDRVTLMTLHASKGLEFPVVYLIAVEEGILPHERSKEDASQLEEERRLLFVGITRAREILHLSSASRREFRGQTRFTVPSTFFQELPIDAMEVSQLQLSTANLSPAEFEYYTPRRGPNNRSAASFGGLDRLFTGADLAAGLSAPRQRPVPEAFEAGVRVRHPEYGEGEVVTASGEGSMRTAIIDFNSPAGRKKFIVAHSVLEIVH